MKRRQFVTLLSGMAFGKAFEITLRSGSATRSAAAFSPGTKE